MKRWATKLFELPITQGKNPKTIKICQILTLDKLDFLRDTVWEKGIHTVSGDAMSHALHGWVDPLLREIGSEPRQTCKKIPIEVGLCSLYEDCINAQKTCQPKHIQTLPSCYEAPLKDPEQQLILSEIVHQWSNGVFVIVVEGKEFTI